MKYEHQPLEEKWHKKWEEAGVFHASNQSDKEKYYALIEFPYPSGQGLHVGHPRSYTAIDIIARKRRMQGYNVLYPIGWDAFGLPTENFAIKNHVHPKIVTEQNIARFKQQLISLGISFDWSREINTTDPEYYKWTQWIFKQLYEDGLARILKILFANSSNFFFSKFIYIANLGIETIITAAIIVLTIEYTFPATE